MSTTATLPQTSFLVDRSQGLVMVPAGTYYLADPCYIVRDGHWLPWLDAAHYQLDNDELGGIMYAHTGDGFPVFGFITGDGDGAWTGSNGAQYTADAGLIGLVPVEYAPDNPYGYQRVTFERPTTCRNRGGCMSFGPVRINTTR
jgi:hypothetical protein